LDEVEKGTGALKLTDARPKVTFVTTPTSIRKTPVLSLRQTSHACARRAPAVGLTDSDQVRTLEVWTDGACPNNGTSKALAGVGVYFGPGDSRNMSKSFLLEPITNQRAELCGLLLALRHAWTNRRLYERVVLTTDSEYSINCVSLWVHSWLANGWKTANKKPVKNRDLIQPLVEVKNRLERFGIQVLLKHCRGHSGIEGNEAADALANAGIHSGDQVTSDEVERWLI
jgi:ribonuclease HI